MPIVLTVTAPLSDEDRSLLLFIMGEETTPVAPPKAKAPKLAAAKPAEADTPEASMDDAVARATELVAAGKTDAVKAALKTAGVKRVSELKPANIPAFLSALSGDA